MKETGRVVLLCHGGVGVEGSVVEVEAVDGVGGEVRAGADVKIGSAGEASVGDMVVGVLGSEKKGEEEEEEEEEEEKRIKRAMRMEEPIGEFGGVRLAVKVETTAKTGIEMEALTGVMGAAMNVVDMVKGVDKGVVVEGVRVVGKRGGRSGGWGVWGDGGGAGKKEEREDGT